MEIDTARGHKRDAGLKVMIFWQNHIDKSRTK